MNDDIDVKNIMALMGLDLTIPAVLREAGVSEDKIDSIVASMDWLYKELEARCVEPTPLF